MHNKTDYPSIIAPADEVFGNFVKILEESQGDDLRMMSAAAKPAFEHILYEDMRQQNLFALERQIPGDILKHVEGRGHLAPTVRAWAARRSIQGTLGRYSPT